MHSCLTHKHLSYTCLLSLHANEYFDKHLRSIRVRRTQCLSCLTFQDGKHYTYFRNRKQLSNNNACLHINLAWQHAAVFGLLPYAVRRFDGSRLTLITLRQDSGRSRVVIRPLALHMSFSRLALAGLLCTRYELYLPDRLILTHTL